MPVMNRAQFKQNMEVGLASQFGLANRAYSPVYPKLFELSSEGSRAHLEDLLMVGLPMAPKKYENDPVEYFAGGEGWVARYIFETYAMAFSFTEEAEADGQYGSLIQKYARFAAHSFNETKEFLGAGIFNNGFDSNYPGGDGVQLFSTAHPLANGSTGSNTLPTAADLDEESLEDLLIIIGDLKEDSGLPMFVQPTALCVANANRFNAYRLRMTVGRPGTMLNDVNAVKDSGAITQVPPIVNIRFLDPDAWFVLTDCPDGLKFIERQAIRKKMEGDFDTGNMRWRMTWRGACGWTNWRGAAGSPGN